MNLGHITGFSRHWYRYEFDKDGKMVERLVSHLIDPNPERVEKWKGLSIRLVTNPDPNERVLHYCGRNMFTDEPMFGGVFEGTQYNDWVRMRGEKAHWDSGYVINYLCDGQPFAYQTVGGDWIAEAKERPYVNVGTIGHVDYMGTREEVLSPLQQAVRDANNGRR